MFRSRIDLGGKTRVLKVGLLAWPALLRCQRSLNSLVKCTTSRLPLNCLWTRQKSTCLNINEAACSWQGSSSHTYLFAPMRTAAAFSWKPANRRCSIACRRASPRCLGRTCADQGHTGIWNIHIHIYMLKAVIIISYDVPTVVRQTWRNVNIRPISGTRKPLSTPSILDWS